VRGEDSGVEDRPGVGDFEEEFKGRSAFEAYVVVVNGRFSLER
jgi:hypothetical protein